MLRVVKKSVLLTGLGMAALLVASSSQAAELDLTGTNLTGSGACEGASSATCSSFTFNGSTFYNFAGALWSVTTTQPTGTGYIDSFVRLEANSGGTKDIIDGVNTSGTWQNDEKPSTNYTHDVLTSDLSSVNINGTQYYQFLLDINQEGGDPLLSLSGLQVCVAAKGSLSNLTDTCYSPNNGDKSTMLYDLDGTLAVPDQQPKTETAPQNNVVLNYKLNHGSGSGDLYFYLPTTMFNVPNNSYLYLWSQFGVPNPYQDNDGYEEWAYLHKGQGTSDCCNLTTAPEPASLVLLGSGLAAASSAMLRRRRAARKQAAQQ
jgi:hypothetical protein